MMHGHEPRRIHIGHHFFGSGNIGDDLMLAGFLDLAGTWLAGATFTCSTPFDRACQQRRFPAIEWLPYEPAVRAASIEACDAWVGVGDTPFQTDVGTWLLDHLAEEAESCRRFGKPMFFVESSPAWRHRWLVQEVRALDGSEREILALLPAAVRDRLEVRCPDYAHDSLDALLNGWGTPEVLVTSRYHGALAGAWAGSRILIVERNGKLSGLAAQLGCPSVGDLRANPDVLGRRYPAAAIGRDILMELAATAARSGEAQAELARAGSPIG